MTTKNGTTAEPSSTRISPACIGRRRAVRGDAGDLLGRQRRKDVFGAELKSRRDRAASCRPSLPALARPQRRDVRHVVAPVPRVELQHAGRASSAPLSGCCSGAREVSSAHDSEQRDPALVQRVEQDERRVDRRALDVSELRPTRSSLYGLIVGLSSVSASLKRMNAFMWLSGTWCTTWRTVQPPSRYGVFSCVSVRPRDGRAQRGRRLADGRDRRAPHLGRDVGIEGEGAGGEARIGFARRSHARILVRA